MKIKIFFAGCLLLMGTIKAVNIAYIKNKSQFPVTITNDSFPTKKVEILPGNLQFLIHLPGTAILEIGRPGWVAIGCGAEWQKHNLENADYEGIVITPEGDFKLKKIS